MGKGSNQILNIGKAFERAAKKAESKAVLSFLGDQMVGVVRERTRAGFGVEFDGDSESRFEPLAKSTIKARKKKTLHPDTTPSTSNLTETGEMLDSLKAKFAKASVEIGATGSRNELLAEVHHYWTDSAGKNRNVTIPARPFLNLSQMEIDLAASLWEDAFNKILEEELRKEGL